LRRSTRKSRGIRPARAIRVRRWKAPRPVRRRVAPSRGHVSATGLRSKVRGRSNPSALPARLGDNEVFETIRVGALRSKGRKSSARARLGPSATLLRDTVADRIRLAWFASLQWETIERIANAGCWVTSTNLRARNLDHVLGRARVLDEHGPSPREHESEGGVSCKLLRETAATIARCTGPVVPRRDRALPRKRKRSRSGVRWIGESLEIKHPPKRSLRKQSSRRAGRSARGPSFRRVVSTIVYLLQKSIDDVDCPMKPHAPERARAVNGG
jgi:hypothetical protein